MKRLSKKPFALILVLSLAICNIGFAQNDFEEFTIIDIEDEPYQVVGGDLAYIEMALSAKLESYVSANELRFYSADQNPDLIAVENTGDQQMVGTIYYDQDYKYKKLAIKEKAEKDKAKNNGARKSNLAPSLGLFSLGLSFGSGYYNSYRGYDPFYNGLNSIYGNSFYGSRSFYSAFYCPAPVYYYRGNTSEYIPGPTQTPDVNPYGEDQQKPINSISYYAQEQASNHEGNDLGKDAFMDKGGKGRIVNEGAGGRSNPDIISAQAAPISNYTETSKNKEELLSIIKKTNFSARPNTKSSIFSQRTNSISGKPSIFNTYINRTPRTSNYNSNGSNSHSYSSPSKYRSSNSFNNRSSYKSNGSSKSNSMSRPSYSAPRTSTSRPMKKSGSIKGKN